MKPKNLKDLLITELENKVKELDYMQAETDEYKAATDAIAKLTDRITELEKLEIDEAKSADNYELEKSKIELETFKAENEAKHNKIQNGLCAAGIVVPTIVTIWGTIKSIKFEQTGTVTTIAGRNFFNKLFKK